MDQNDAGVIAAERARMAAILALPEAAGRETFALHLASMPDMHVAGARALLQASAQQVTLHGALVCLGYTDEPLVLESMSRPVIERPRFDSCFAAAGRGMQ